MRKEFLILIGLFLSMAVFGVMVMALTSYTSNAHVEIPGYLSITVNSSSVTWGSMVPGENDKPGAPNPLQVTVGAESNVNVDIDTKASAENFACTIGTCNIPFPVGNMEWGISLGSETNNYTTTDAEVCDNKAPAGICHIYHDLSIPAALPAGTYDVGIVITGRPHA